MLKRLFILKRIILLEHLLKILKMKYNNLIIKIIIIIVIIIAIIF